MNINKLEQLVPDGWPHSPSEKFEKKEIAEQVIQEAIDQIKFSARNTTKWQFECLTNGIEAVRSGMYVLAVNEAMSCSYSESDVSRPAEFWVELSDNQVIEVLDRSLARLKGEPPK